jgi:hypothetical protein
MWDTKPPLPPAKSSRNIITEDKSGCIYVCHEVPNGQLHVTWYYTPIASEFHSGQTVKVQVGGDTLYLDSEAVAGNAGMLIQGSLKIGENQYLNSLIQTGKNTYSASRGIKSGLVPYMTGAVGSSYVGATYFIEAFAYTTSGGFFFGADRGGKITNGDLDIYIGEGEGAIRDALKVYSSQRMKTSGVFGDAGTSNFPAYICEKIPNPTYTPN